LNALISYDISINNLDLVPKNIFLDIYDNIKIEGFEILDFFDLKNKISEEKKDIIKSLGYILYELIFKKKYNNDENALKSCSDKHLKTFLIKILGKNRQIYSINDILVDKAFIQKLFDLNLYNEILIPNLESKFI